MSVLADLSSCDSHQWIPSGSTTTKTRRAHVTPRPLRVAYLTPLEPNPHLLDAVFNEAMSRWGGGRTPVITSDGAAIAVHDWRFLDLWDADIIYSYVPLSDVLRDRIAYSLAPGVIKTHPVIEYPLDSYFFRPQLDNVCTALQAISILPRMARLQEVRGEAAFEVLDRDSASEVPRDLRESFGFLSDTWTRGVEAVEPPRAR